MITTQSREVEVTIQFSEDDEQCSLSEEQQALVKAHRHRFVGKVMYFCINGTYVTIKYTSIGSAMSSGDYDRVVLENLLNTST